jgi:hypothetical protein
VNSEKSTQLLSPADHFSVLLSPTPRGARLARLLATDWMRDRDLPHPTTHGRLPGRDFRLALLDRDGTLRIEVMDTRGDDLPLHHRPAPDAESGRGLLLVDALADRWGVRLGPVPRKTVWAEIDLPPS